jgi:hypothetical protein
MNLDNAKAQPLFDDVLPASDITGMVRRGDHHTSVDAAVVVERKRNGLHEAVLRAFDEYGPMTDETLERLDRFKDCGPSTIRKRRSELYKEFGLLVVHGETRNSRGRKMIVWRRA